MRKFYFEYEQEEDEFVIMEESGGQEHGQYYDTACFWTKDRTSAKDAVDLLNELAKAGSNR